MNQFATYQEAEELNSDCVFCGKKKFTIFLGLATPTKEVTHSLRRCQKPGCENHCAWDHYKKPATLVEYGNTDHVSMVSNRHN